MTTQANIEAKVAITLAQVQAKAVAFSETRMPTIKAISTMLGFYGVEHTFIHGNTIRIAGVFADGSKGYTTMIDSSKAYYSRNSVYTAREVLALLNK